MGKIIKIAITGGPCAGKTSVINALKKSVIEKHKMLCVSESATELFTSGLTPAFCNSFEEYICYQIELQIKKEQIYEEAAKSSKSNVIIMFDRGIPDIAAYMDKESYANVLKKFGLTSITALERYDYVLFLESCAKMNSNAYVTTDVRKENAEEAIILNELTKQAWNTHKCYECIENCNSIEKKITQTIQSIVKISRV